MQLTVVLMAHCIYTVLYILTYSNGCCRVYLSWYKLKTQVSNLKVRVRTWSLQTLQSTPTFLSYKYSIPSVRSCFMSQYYTDLSWGSFPLIANINSHVRCECLHLIKINCRALWLNECTRRELATLVMNGKVALHCNYYSRMR